MKPCHYLSINYLIINFKVRFLVFLVFIARFMYFHRCIYGYEIPKKQCNAIKIRKV